MNNQQNQLMSEGGENWKGKTLFLGGLAGLLVGVLSAFLYIKSASQRTDGTQPKAPSVGEAIRVGSVLLGVVKTVTDWANR